MKKLLFILGFLILWQTQGLCGPSNTMNITPVAVTATTITAADENTRNTEISTKYNAHSHLDLVSTTSTDFLIGSGTYSGTNMTLSFSNAATPPQLKWDAIDGRFEVSEGTATFYAILMTTGTNYKFRLDGSTQGDVLAFDGGYWTRVAAGTAGQYLQTRGTSGPPEWASVIRSDQAIGVAANPTTTSATFVDLDDMEIAMTTDANPVLVLFTGDVYNSNAGQQVFIIIEVDGTTKAESERSPQWDTNGYPKTLATSWIGTLAAGGHTFKVQWKVSANTGTAAGVRRAMQVIELR